MTITCSSELRLAESCVDSLIPNDPETDKIDSIGMLRSHIVEVSLEQEPTYWKRRMRDLLRVMGSKEMRMAHNLLWVSLLLKLLMLRLIIHKRKLQIQRKKTRALEDLECKEVEMDDWLFEFAQLFRTHVGIDPNAHIDLHELGIEKCYLKRW